MLLLELFCYGTWSEFKAHEAALPPLSEAQRLKLKQLTAVSLATASKTLAYDDLMAALDIGSAREVRARYGVAFFAHHPSPLAARIQLQPRLIPKRNARHALSCHLTPTCLTRSPAYPSNIQLEAFLIEHLLYTGALKGKLDPARRALVVHEAAGRDVRPERLPELAAALDGWCARRLMDARALPFVL